MDRAKIITLLSIFLILNILDIVLTVSVISEGKGLEVNPVMAYLLENSFAVFTAVKITAGFFIALLLFRLYKKHVKAAKITATIIIAAYVFIVANNAVVSAETVKVNETGVVNIQICAVDYLNYRGIDFYGGGGTCYTPLNYLYLDFSQYPEIQSIDFYYRVYTESNPKAEYKLALFENGVFDRFIDDTTGAVGMPIRLERNGYDVVEGQIYFYPDLSNTGYYHVKILFDIFSYNKSNIVYGNAVYLINYTSDWDVRLYLAATGADEVGAHTVDYPSLAFKHCSFSDKYELAEYNNASVNYCSNDIVNEYEYMYVYNETTGIEDGYINVTKLSGTSKWVVYTKSYLTDYIYRQEIDSDLNDVNFTWDLAGYLINASVYYTSTKYKTIYFTQPNFSTYSPPTGTSTVTFYFMDSKTGALIPNVNLTLKESFIGNSEVINGTYDYSVTVNNLNDLEVYTYTASRAGYVTVNGYVYYPPAGKETTVYVYMIPIEQPSDANNSIISFKVTTDFGDYVIPLSDAAVTLNGETKLTNYQGYVSFEVPKNDTYSYIVSKNGYFSKSGTITATQDYHLISVKLDQMVSTPTPTPTPTGTPTPGSGTGTGTGGTGYTADEGLRQAARDTLTNYYQIVPGFFGLVFLLFFMATLNGVWRRRR